MPMDKGYGSGIIKANQAPAGNTLPDGIEDLVNLAMDPMYDTPDPTDAGALQTGTMPMNTNAPALDFRSQPTYEAGGMIGPGGQPARPGGLNTQSQQGVTPEMMQQEVQRIVRENPQQVLKIKQAVMQALQTGDLTPEELNMIAQLTVAAAQNPEVYPQVRQFAIQQGLATEQDLPQQYDQGLVFTLLLVVQAAQAQLSGQPMSAGQPPEASMMSGGALPEKSRNADGSIKINAHEGEYVIPADVVRRKGTDFFDKMIEQDGKGKS